MTPLPDEYRYAAAVTARVPRPFHYRWLLPALLGVDARRWRAVQVGSLAALCGLLWAQTGAWWSVLLVVGLSGLTFNLRHPILVDLPALALAYGAAVAWDHKMWWLAVPLVLVAGCVKESAPVFAVAFAWHPVLLVGLIPVAVRHLMDPGPDPIPDGAAHDALERPVRVSWAHHKALPLWVYVLPWGVLLAALTNGSPQLWVALGLAYAQLLVATDAVRLYQWAAPAVIVAAVPVLGGPWLAVALVLHLVNPFRTEGI